MTVDKLKALELHRKARGKIRNYPTINVRNEDDMAMVYVPGSVFPAREILAGRQFPDLQAEPGLGTGRRA